MAKKKKKPVKKKEAKPKIALEFFNDQIKKEKFEWSKTLSPKEVAFVYDMVRNKNNLRQFQPTHGQVKWLMLIKAKGLV